MKNMDIGYVYKSCEKGGIPVAIALEVWGDYALFTRPEMKVERVTYDIITPSAARGLIEAIYFHPGLRWQIDRIHVCAPIKHGHIRRNEVRSVVFKEKLKAAMERGRENPYINTQEDIQQRASLLLRDVHYVIEAHFEMTEKAAPGDNPGKFRDIVRRRMEKGQCYHRPYFGCREFPACFRPCGELPPCPPELRGERDLGWMLYDMDYTDPGNITPRFFHAVLHDGVLKVPPWNSGEVRG